MAFSSFPWPFRRRAGGSGSGETGPSKPSAAEGKEEDAEELGVTPQLLDFLRTLSPDAFKSSALQLHQGTPSFLPSRFRSPASSLSITGGAMLCHRRIRGVGGRALGLAAAARRPRARQSQGRSPADLVLRFAQERDGSQVSNCNLWSLQELAKVRYDLCPRHMKDKQFWTYILS